MMKDGARLRWPWLRFPRRHGNAAHMTPAQCKPVESGKRSVLYGTGPRERALAGKEAADFILAHRIAVPAFSELTAKRIQGLRA